MEWRRANPERAREIGAASLRRRRPKVLAYLRDYYRKNRDRELAQAKDRHVSLKANAYQAYGGARCSCCGEHRLPFLSLDHMDGKGSQHRRSIGRGSNIYAWLRDNGYPPGFQVLCHNCNHGRYLNGGVCPHAEAQYGITIVEVMR